VRILENIPLAPLTTLQVGGPARFFLEARTGNEVREAVVYAADKRLPLFVLGGGSNLLIADEGWPGLVLKISLAGVEHENQGDSLIFHAAAGESWDKFVEFTLSKNCAGLECLSGIPGSVGGTPVQNVGAYGQEVSESIASVRVLEIASGAVRELSNVECGFAYRNSIFNTSNRGHYIVLNVTYKLEQNGRPTLAYADLKNYFAGAVQPPSLQQVREAVLNIRRSKAMLIVPGDEDCRSAGSFFKNPLLSSAEVERIQRLAQERVPGKALSQFPGTAGMVKLSAAWLVEQSGFPKGYARGPVGISRKHALAIVNRGGATARDVIALKDEVQQKVFEIWGVRLQPEPEFVDFDLESANAR
jgi:UDP-N-acetylmuramate dehydrogenase